MADKPDCKDEMEGLIEVADELEAKIIDLKAEIKDKASGKTSVPAPAVKTADAPTKPAQYTGKGKGKARANPVSTSSPSFGCLALGARSETAIQPRTYFRTTWGPICACM
jgi:hypothetical protein